MTIFRGRQLYFLGCAHELKSFPGGVLFPLNLTLLFIS